jgi:hypothetical protein
MKLEELYTSVADFDGQGIGSAFDASSDRDHALDCFAECIEDGRPTRVFHLMFDLATGELETSREVTDDFMDEIATLAIAAE